MAKNHHIVPRSAGGWAVKADRAKRAFSTHRTQQEAISRGRELSRNQGTELLIHGKDGRIRERDSHGGDPFPPKG